MIVKSSKEYKYMMIASIVIVALCVLLIFIDATDDDGRIYSMHELKVLFAILSIFALSMWMLLFRLYMVLGRTIIMCQEGVTIKFLWVKRSYKWSDLKTKSIENYENSFGYLDYYKEGVFFSTKHIKRPLCLKPSTFSIFVSVFDCFFVYFDPQIEFNKLTNRCPDTYMVNKKEFVHKMKEWNVILKTSDEKTKR